jgi:hypothetical protein
VLPDSWIAKIFSKFEARYGSLFLDRWRGCDMDNVRETWAEELAGFKDQPERIAYALKSLSDERFPPTLPEFIAACRKAPAKASGPALRYVPTLEDEERARQAAASAAKAIKKFSGDGIDEHWATHPRTPAHMRMILDAAKRDQRFKPCIAQMAEQGVCTAEGHLLKTYKDGQWWPLHRRAA